jgi:purine-binding chemotaxis protein CheW
MKTTGSEIPAPGTKDVTLIVLELDGRQFALPVDHVNEVLRMVAITPLPDAPAWVAGAINVRGDVVPVIDLRARLGLRPRTYCLDTPIFVVTVFGRRMAVVPDAAVEVVELPSRSLDDPDELIGPDHPIAHLARVEGRVVPVLVLERICDGAQSLALPQDDFSAA